MSTKVPEKCPRCNRDTMPESAYPFVEQYGVVYQQWKYHCGVCSNIWANAAQREHNNEYVRRAVRDSKGIYG